MERDIGIGLERSCVSDRTGDWVRTAPDDPGFERIEARFSGYAFAPHRHDSYAIGYTIAGVQSFAYRGERRASLPGHIVVLHPDEIHDGEAGTDHGFRYRMVYLEPVLIRAAMRDPSAALPFVRGGISRSTELFGALQAILGELDEPIEGLQREEALTRIADELAAASDNGPRQPLRPDIAAMTRLATLMTEDCHEAIGSERLERESGHDRYAIARQFRACFGTSPHRYLVMRRLDLARRELKAGASLADAAVCAGFADQSHMTRHFKAAYGVSPGRWRQLLA